MTATEYLALLGVLSQLLSEIERVALVAVREHAKYELALIFKAFTEEKYYNRGGQARPIEPYGPKWRKVKIKRKWSLKRGWANGRLGRAVGSESAIRPTDKGYRIDLSRADPKVRRYTARGNPNSFIYRKAPGLMNMAQGYKERHETAIRSAVRPLIANLRGVAKKLGINEKEVRVNVALRLDPMLEAAARRNQYAREKTWSRVGLVQNRDAGGRFQGVRGVRYAR